MVNLTVNALPCPKQSERLQVARQRGYRLIREVPMNRKLTSEQLRRKMKRFETF
jgi:hypothetical protein